MTIPEALVIIAALALVAWYWYLMSKTEPPHFDRRDYMWRYDTKTSYSPEPPKEKPTGTAPKPLNTSGKVSTNGTREK